MAEFEVLNDAAFAALNRRTARAEKARIRAVSVAYDAGAGGVSIRLSNGVSALFPLALLPGLETARAEDLTGMVVEGDGFGLHVPALDADLSIPQLFEDHLGTVTLKQAHSRITASRANGRLGGRPRKNAA